MTTQKSSRWDLSTRGYGPRREPFATILNFSLKVRPVMLTPATPVLHYLTTKNRSENTEYSVFDMRDDCQVEVRVQSPTMVGRILTEPTPWI